jgi:hypothetical protein
MPMRRGSALAVGRQMTGDSSKDEIWAQLRNFADVLEATPFVGGRLITEEEGAIQGSGLVFAAGVARNIPHRLGRKASGFVEVYGVDTPSAGAVGLFPVAHINGVTRDTHVTAQPTNDGTCWMWVF